MGVIVDTGIQKEIDQLEAKGAFSLADTFRQANQISLESLAFMTNIPPEYEALVANSSAYQARREQDEEKTKEDDEEKKDAAERAAAYQQEIDENMLQFSIDGEDIQISQADMRKVVERRLKELEKEKQDLEKSGANPQELRHVDNMIDEYTPIDNDLQNHKADTATTNALQDMMKRDPDLLPETKEETQQAKTPSPSPDAVTQQPSAVQAANAAPASLKVAFVQSATPAASPSSAPSAPSVEQQKQQANNAFAAFT